MKLSKYICPWCESHRLHYAENSQGLIKLCCREPGEFSCPDTTGWCLSEKEADEYAEELPRISVAEGEPPIKPKQNDQTAPTASDNEAAQPQEQAGEAVRTAEKYRGLAEPLAKRAGVSFSEFDEAMNRWLDSDRKKPVIKIEPAKEESREWVELTDEEIEDAWCKYGDEMGGADQSDALRIGREIEAACREKNAAQPKEKP